MSKERTLAEAGNAAQGERTLPDGWMWTTLGEAYVIVLGQSPPSSTYNTEGVGLPFYQGKAEFGDLYPTPAKWCSKPNKIAEAGDVLISVRAPVGPTNLCREQSCIGRGLSAIRPTDGMSSLYILYYLRSVEQDWQGKATGTTFSAITGNVLRGQAVPIAPIPEQRRIVAEIETQFTRLDASVAALERARANIRRFRASVLQAACEGRIVPTEAELARAEGRDYEPADQLLARILAERRARWEAEEWEKEIENAKQKATKAARKAAGHPLKRGEKLAPEEWQNLPEDVYGRYLPKDDRWKQKYKEPVPPVAEGLPELPEGWVWTGFDSLLREPLRNGRSAKASQSDDGIRTLTLTAVTLGDFSLENTKLTVADPSKVEDLWIQPGDLFIERSNTPELVGTARLYRGKPNFAIFPDLLIRARVVDKISSRYIEVALQSEPTRSYFKRSAQGISGTMPKISQSTVRNLSVPLPPLAEQRRIVAEVERRLSLVAALEASVEAALARARRLRQAVLKHAFEGRLVPQDPHDVPASALLARIRAQRENVQKTGRGKRDARQMQLPTM